jgi:hypothetical protein
MSKRLLLTLALTACGHRDLTPLGNDAPFTDRTADLTQRLLTETGGRVDWSQAHDLIAFDRRADDDFFDVWTMRPDGTDQHCFTCDLPGLPTKNLGQPAWSPDGTKWIFSANLDREKPLAQLNDIYVMDFPSGENLKRLTTGGYNEHATFTPDGERVVWMSSADNVKGGTDYWSAKLDGSDLTRLSRLTVPGAAAAVERYPCRWGISEALRVNLGDGISYSSFFGRRDQSEARGTRRPLNVFDRKTSCPSECWTIAYTPCWSRWTTRLRVSGLTSQYSGTPILAYQSSLRSPSCVRLEGETTSMTSSGCPDSSPLGPAAS